MTGGIVPGAAPTGGTAADTGATGGIVPGAAATGGTAAGTPGTSGGITTGFAGGNPTTGLNTDGSIGQAGRVGTALNGRPIGFPGSGLGSRENSSGPTAISSQTR
jgi:hypothetical protein